MFDGAGTDPPESGSSGSEREIRAGPTVLTHHADSSLEAQCQCPAVGHETGYDEDVKLGAMGTYSQRVLMGLWLLRTPTRPLQVKARRLPLNLGRMRRTERTASPTDIVFDALVELARDGRCWVPVRQIQAQTSLRLEELLEEWEYGSHLQG